MVTRSNQSKAKRAHIDERRRGTASEKSSGVGMFNVRTQYIGFVRGYYRCLESPNQLGPDCEHIPSTASSPAGCLDVSHLSQVSDLGAV